MLIDAILSPEIKLNSVPEVAKAAEEIGFDAIWVSETLHNPFFPCVLIAEHTERINFGTAVAISFGRSPSVMAHTAWDLANLSKGRFILGLGTQVKAHIERRYGMPWPESPVNKFQEQIEVIQSFWQAWQNGDKLNFRGEYYQITLTSPFFSPSKIENPEIPIYIAGVNTGLAKLAGGSAEGFHAHPFHTPKYLGEVIVPAIYHGRNKSGDKNPGTKMVVNAFVVTNLEERELVRQQISFYASTPTYRPVLAIHGWEEVGAQLSALASRKKWSEMPNLITDEILAEVATISDEADLPAALSERYQGLADRISIYIPFQPGARDSFWRNLIHSLGNE